MKKIFLLSLVLTSCVDLNPEPNFNAEVYITGKNINFVRSGDINLSNVGDTTILNLKFGSIVEVYSDSILTIRVFSISPKYRTYPNRSNNVNVYQTAIN